MLDVASKDTRSAVGAPYFSREFSPSALEFRLDDAIAKAPSVVRIVAYTAVWGVAYQIVAALMQFIALGYLIRAVGREQFGLWMVVYAVAMWMPLFMFGQSNVILTRFSQTIFMDVAEARRILTSSLIICLVGAGVALSVLLVFAPLVPWKGWLHMRSTGATQAIPTGLAALTVAIVAVPASLSGYAMLATRRGVLNHQIMIGSQLICLAVFLLGIAVHWPLWALGSILVAPLCLAGITLFAVGIRAGHFPLPNFSCVNRSSVKKAMTLGLTIFTLDVASVLLLRTPELIVVRLRGIDEVAALAAGSRLSLVLLAIVQSILVAIWPIISEAAARNDWRWIRLAFIGSLSAIVLVWGSGSTAIWFLGPFFIEKWTGIPNLVSGALFMAIILQALSLGLQSWIFTLLSALSMFTTQLFAAFGAVVLYFVLALVFGEAWGAVGVVLAQAAAIFLFALPTGLFAIVRRIYHGDPVLTFDRGGRIVRNLAWAGPKPTGLPTWNNVVPNVRDRICPRFPIK